MKYRLLARYLVLGAAPLGLGVRPPRLPRPAAASAQQPGLSARDSALHVLNRLAYGPRPGEVARVAATGVMPWIDQQLAPDRIDDAALARREQQVELLRYDRVDLARLFVGAQRERQREAASATRDTLAEPPPSQLHHRGRPRAARLPEPGRVRAAP